MASDEAQGAETSAAPAVNLVDLALSALLARAVYAVADLGVADLLAEGPRSVAELADTLGVQVSGLHQVMRTLTGLGLFRRDGDGRFGLTPVGESLRRDHPSGVRDLVTILSGSPTWEGIGAFPEILTTGTSGVELAHGRKMFDYMRAHPDQSAAYNRMMVAAHATEPDAVAEAYDFSGLASLVDVGGGIGTLLAAILHANPSLHGVLFDQPSVVEQAKGVMAATQLADRCDFVAGDFFESVPDGGHAYLLSHILHDWGEDACLTILRNCRRAMRDDGRVLIVEMVIPPGDEPHRGKVFDLLMLVLYAGQERTAEEYGELLAKADLRLERVVPTNSSVSIVEARPL